MKGKHQVLLMLVIKGKSKPLKGRFACTTCCTNSSRSGGIVTVQSQSHCRVWHERAADLGEKSLGRVLGILGKVCKALLCLCVIFCSLQGRVLAKGASTCTEMSIKTREVGGRAQGGWGVSPAQPGLVCTA